MLFKNEFLRRFTLLGLFWALGLGSVSGAGWKTLPGHVPAVTRRLAATGAVPATNELRLAIGLPLRDAAGLDRFLAAISDPASPHFRHYLTPEAFTARFGPTEADYAAVMDYARTNGLSITATHGNRLLLDVSGPAANVERAFHLHLRTFHHPTEARDFFAPDAEPRLEDWLPVADVAGLSDYARPHSKLHRAEATAKIAPKSGSGPGGDYLGNDFRNAYVPGTALTGAGQMVGLVEFDGFYASDILAYENLLPGQPSVPLQTVLLDGFSGTPTPGRNSGNDEVSLDIELALAMAPGLAKIVVFEAGPNGFQNDILNAMVANSAVKNLSCSWGWNGGPDATTETIFKQMAAQGQSFFNATGDSDAFTPGQLDDPTQVTGPSASPNITQVGGTTLTMNGPDYVSETVWNSGGGTGSSGGISTANPIPVWQQGINMTANHGSTTGRNVPDVALTADNVYVTYGNGRNGTFIGTSCAAPLWAGFTALVNQQAAAAANPPVGFINPAIYALGKRADSNLYFHDTTVGDNFWSGSPTDFPATTGYDLCTGWGTPKGTNLINALANFSPTVNVADTVRPQLSITNPVNNLKWSNAVFTVSGTATDNVAVASVFYSLNGAGWLPATTANHWSNWTANVTLITGTNVVQAYAEDTSGNFSTTNRVSWFCILSAPLTVRTNGRGSISPNDNGVWLQLGASYSLTATAAAGFKFTSWTDQNHTSLTNSPTLKFIMASNLDFTANFVDIVKPTNGITSPMPSQRWSNSVFMVTGKAGDNVGVVSVFYSLNNGNWLAASTINNWSNWAAGVTLTPGTNSLQSYAVDGAANFSATNQVSLVYILSAPLTVSTNGRGSISPNYNGTWLQIGATYTLTATAAAGFKFAGWTDGRGNVVTNAALKFIMSSNLTFTANFVDIASPTLSFTQPVNNQRWSNSVFTISGKASDNVAVANVFYSLNGANWLAAATANSWSNWTAQVNLVPGTNTILACAVDAAGNVSATNRVSFVFVFAMGGLWNTMQFQTPAQLTWDSGNGLLGGNSFGVTSGTIAFKPDGTLSGQFENPFTGSYVLRSNGVVAAIIDTSGTRNHFKLFINAGQDTLTLADAQLNADNNQQELVLFLRAPVANTLASMAGSWKAVQFQTPAQMAWDLSNGLQGGGNFTATNGNLILNANGTASGNLAGTFTGSYQVGSNGLIHLVTVAGGQTNLHTLFVNASGNLMSLVEGAFNPNENDQQITLFERVPGSVLPADVLGSWNVVQLQTPEQMAWDALNGLQGGGNFGAASGSLNFNVDGTLSGNLSGAFSGTYHVSNTGVIRLNTIAGGETNNTTLFINASKDAMMGVDSQRDTSHNYQQILILQRTPAN